MRTVALSFFVSLCALAWSSQSTDLLNQVQHARSAEEFSRIVESARNGSTGSTGSTFLDSELSLADSTDNWKKAQTRLEKALKAASALEDSPNKARISDPNKAVKEILRDPRYRDPGTTQGRNWLSKSLERLQKAIEDYFAKLTNKPDRAGAALVGLGAGGLDVIVWILLGGGLLLFLGFFLARFKYVKNSRAKRLGIMDEDEPDLTADEWLTKAVQLESESRYREAVRCLFLASLIRLDEAGYLRFVRADTNWEHLYRFEANRERPADLDLRTATKEFDRIWYGHRVKGMSDSAWFKEFYGKVLERVKGVVR